MSFLFEHLSAEQLSSLNRNETVFFFPVGPLEDHGPHLPMGMDLLEARKLSELSADKLEKEQKGWAGVVMPSLPLGIESDTTKLSITVRPHVLRDWLVDSCLSLARLGFRHFVCFTGHLGPKQLTAIEDAGKLVNRRYFYRGKNAPRLLSANSSLFDAKDCAKNLFWVDPKEHGGSRDTSVGLFLKPDLVEPHYSELGAIERKAGFLARMSDRLFHHTSGYWGNPSKANKEAGEKALSETIEKSFPKLKSVWNGKRPGSLFRSWYSVIPMNKSFFKSWVLFFAVMIIMSLWFFVSISGPWT